MPPIWIRTRIAIWPNRLNPLPVLTVARPVVERAEAEVNRASSAETGAAAWLNGRANSTQPAKI